MNEREFFLQRQADERAAAARAHGEVPSGSAQPDILTRQPKEVIGERRIIVGGKTYVAIDAGHASLFNRHIVAAEKAKGEPRGKRPKRR